MRDPLAQVPVRYKLPLTYALFCLFSLGFGGLILTGIAHDALERQIRLRLDESSAYTRLIVDKDLELLGRRVEDFASDGHIRLEFERLLSESRVERQPPAPGAVAEGAELVRHLRFNKLSLVAEFVDAYLLSRDGQVLLYAFSGQQTPPVGWRSERLWYGPLTAPQAEHPYPTFVISAPVMAIQGQRVLGYLQVVVQADLWAQGLRRTLAVTSVQDLEVVLSSPNGARLPLLKADGSALELVDWPTLTSPHPQTGWNVELAIDPRSADRSLARLVSTLVAMGILLLLLTLLLFLPVRHFLLAPLAKLEGAAMQISQGDFSARVGWSTGDEIGHLAAAFDLMAEANETRTRDLAASAEELRLSEGAVRIERDRLSAVLLSMKDGLFILTRDGRVSLSNPASVGLLKALQLERCGVCLECRGSRRADLGRSGMANCFDCMSDFATATGGCEVTVAGRIYDLRVTPLRLPSGEETERVYVSRDITEKRRLAARQSHQERLSVVGEVAAVMAHELNNPLAAISMFSQMLRDGLDPISPLYQHAVVVHRNTLICKRTVRSLLDLAATSEPHPALFALEDLVADVLELLRPVANQGRVQLEFEEDLSEEGTLFCDELQLRQALVNLILNAIQAVDKTGAGRVQVKTAMRAGQLVLRVSDNGPGVPEALVEHIFEPFFTTKPPGEGTGLGLPTARRVVEAQGGRLSCCVGASGGATFEIVLPQATAITLDSG